MNPSDLSLQLDNVDLARGGRMLVAGLSFRLEAGQLALVTGPNGTGKTTLLRTIAGLSPPARGEIRILGRPIGALEPAERRFISYQGHLEGLKKDLTIEENIIFIRDLLLSSKNLHEILQELGLADIRHRIVRQLSAGQKRRTALACLRMSEAPVLLLDEPLTNLDSEGRALIGRWVDEHLAEKGLAVVATHRAEDLMRPGATLVEL